MRVVILSLAAYVSMACASQTPPVPTRVLALQELDSRTIAALNPARTVFIFEIAPLEAHGPHIPIGNDSYQGDYSAARMAEQLADSLPEWTIVRLPNLWFGVDGANRISEREDVRGTISLRPSTLRAIAADIGSQLAEQGFHWLFLVHVHGAPLEHVALSDAADFVRETRGMGMFNVGSVDYTASDSAVDSLVAQRLSSAERSRIGFDIHAGFTEVSTTLATRPDLVAKDFRSLPDVKVADWDELLLAGRRPDWSGYWSAPALADSVIGRRILDSWAMRWTRTALRALRGEEVATLPRYPAGLPDDNPVMRMSARTVARQRAFDSVFTVWLANRKSLVDK